MIVPPPDVISVRGGAWRCGATLNWSLRNRCTLIFVLVYGNSDCECWEQTLYVGLFARYSAHYYSFFWRGVTIITELQCANSAPAPEALKLNDFLSNGTMCIMTWALSCVYSYGSQGACLNALSSFWQKYVQLNDFTPQRLDGILHLNISNWVHQFERGLFRKCG